MQINKLHVQPHSVLAPKGQKLTQPSGPDAGTVNSPTRDLTSGVDAVKSYTDQLQDIPEVRSEVVEAARARFESGEYTTSQSAVETAEAILGRS